MQIAQGRRPYRGRFAPTPSGPLHFGSLLAALGSFLQARAQGGSWAIRIDDADQPRVVAGAADAILRDLERLGLHWDGPVLYETQCLESYHGALDTLSGAGETFPCACSRSDLVSGVYPGTCRNGLPPGKPPRSVRLRTPSEPVAFNDAVQGPFTQNIQEEVGDFVILRADGIHAYHLTVVVDDALQGITEVVRGSDLLDSTARQIVLQRALGVPTPGYVHLPIATNTLGQKLSKQTGARPIAAEPPASLLHRGLAFLGHKPPPDLSGAGAEALLTWAMAHWRLERVPRTREMTVPAPQQALPA